MKPLTVCDRCACFDVHYGRGTILCAMRASLPDTIPPLSESEGKSILTSLILRILAALRTFLPTFRRCPRIVQGLRREIDLKIRRDWRRLPLACEHLLGRCQDP